MTKNILRVEVVRSKVRAYSSMSEVSARAIVTTLQQYYTDVVLTNIDTQADLEALVERQPDLVFLGIHYVKDDTELATKIWASDVLEAHGIRHTGSQMLSHRLGVNKHLAKERMVENNLKTAAFQIVRRGDEKITDEGALHFPLFVKPSNKGGGQGIDEFSIVHTVKELQEKIASIHYDHESDALIETYLRGREFSVAVIDDSTTHQLTAMPIELIASKDSNGDRMLSRAVKTADEETTVLGVTDAAVHLKLTTFAIDAFRALGARDYGRIDVRFDDEGTPHFLEVNLIPSLIDNYGSFPRAYALNLGLGYEAMILHIVRLALAHETQATIAAY